ncbi:MAG: DUF362 domain-containing protein [Dehalococcoidales bacterium]|nr:DUF362 domain-containing protein [Dehalococcoidales bacterium]
MKKVIKKSRVALVACDTYNNNEVYEAVKRGLDLIGGLARYVKSGEKIVLKPNVLIGAAPERCVCTHPAVFRAVGKILIEAGVDVSCGDSPGFGGCRVNMRLAGLKQVADELGIPFADFSHGRVVMHKEALLNRRFTIANGVLDADGLVSLPKLKTHGLTRMTGAVKNQFGCIPGFIKGQHHARTPDPFDFATMLVDLNTLIKSRLYIMDAIMAMEGNGPRSGNPRKLGVILVSDDPIALDAVACKLIDLEPSLVPTSQPGEKSGLGTYRYENIEIVGDDVEKYICRDFDVVRKPPVPAAGGRFGRFVKSHASPRPVIDGKLCTACGTCVKHCPVGPKAVDWLRGDESRPPVYNYGRCIRCFCCQEMCPEGAISVKEPLLGKLFFS